MMALSPNTSKDLYANKNILAPMVRIGTLPSRMTSLHFGADLVYSEELIDFKLIRCHRKVNHVLSTVDFVTDEGLVVFRTCSQEKEKVILQIGTADPDRALKAAKLVENDVAGVDVNMGCPKEFSIKGGMGAALLTQPHKIKQILTTLVQGLKIPVSCKIRILPELADTLALARMIASTGVSALGVHGRLRDERPRHDNHDDVIKAVAEEVGGQVVVIANGGSNVIHCKADIDVFKKLTGCSSVMLARAAGWNQAIFDGYSKVQDAILYYIKQAVLFDNDWSNTKYCVQYMLRDQLESEQGKKLTAAKSNREICDIFGLVEYHDKIKSEQLSRKRKCEDSTTGQVKRFKLDDGVECIEMDGVVFDKREYHVKQTPKLLLYEHCVRHRWRNPEYISVQGADRLFESKVKVNGTIYRSSVRLMSKKNCEQSAAVVCLSILGVKTNRKSVEPNYNEATTSSQELCDAEKKENTNTINAEVNSVCRNCSNDKIELTEVEKSSLSSLNGSVHDLNVQNQTLM